MAAALVQLAKYEDLVQVIIHNPIKIVLIGAGSAGPVLSNVSPLVARVITIFELSQK